MSMVGTDTRWSLLEGTLPMLIGGELVGSEQSSAAISPRDRREVARFATASPEQVDAAVAAAKAAAPGWAATPGSDRAKVLLAIAEVIEAHRDELVFLDAVDMGKPVSAGQWSDIPVSLEALAYFAGRALDLRGSAVDLTDLGIHHRQQHQPYGVVLEVLPWNGPLWTGVQRVAAILAAGNAAVVKPAEVASLSWLRLAQLLVDVVPAGVLTVITGSGSRVGSALVTHRDVDMVSLTGGTDTGLRVMADLAQARQVKPLSLELGGKNPNLVLADADLDEAVRWSAMGAFANSGQVCVCGSRILVAREIHDEFAERLVAAAEAMVVGDPLDPATGMGPVVSEVHHDSIRAYLAGAEGDGRVLTGGGHYEDEFRAGGWFIPPTVIADVDPGCTIAREEVFGPVVTLTAFDDLDDAIRIANDTDYGLASGVFTSSVTSAAKVADALQAGQVYVNQWFSPGVSQAPSSGWKQSGLGEVGMEKYLRSKNVFTRYA